MAISLAPEARTQGNISLLSNKTEVPEKVTESRIEQAEYALPNRDPQEIRADFWLGHEQRLRELTSVQQEIELRRSRLGLVEEISMGAAQEGRDLSVQERDFILNLSNEQAAQPNVVIEKLFAKRFVDDLDTPDDPVYQEALEEDPENTPVVRDAFEDFSSKQQIARRIFEDAENRFNTAGFGRVALDFAKGVIPGYSWLVNRDRIETGTSALLLGDNISDQMRSLYLLPPEEFERTLREVVDDIGRENVLESLNYANAAIEYAGDEELWDNLFTGLDAVDIGTLGASALIRYSAKAQRAIRGATQAQNSVARQVAQGDVSGAARTATRNRLSRIVPTGSVDNLSPTRTKAEDRIDELMEEAPSLMNPETYVSNPGKMSNERARRLEEDLSTNRDLLLSSMVDIPVIQRIPEEALQRAFAKAEERFRTSFPNLEDFVIDVRPVREAEEAYGAVDHIEILLGDKGAQPLTRASKAQFYAEKMYRLPEGSYDIIQDEGGFFVRVTKNIDETDTDVADLRIQADYATPSNLVNTWTHLLSEADDRLAKAHNEVRKVATYGGNAMMSRLAEAAKNIGRLSRTENSRLNQIMDKGRFLYRTVKAPDGAQKKVQGRFYKNQYELEEAYLSAFNTLPSDKESLAYFTFRQIMDFDYIQRNVGMARDKMRMGVEQYSIGTHIPQADGTARYGNSPFFEARQVDALPGNSEGAYGVAWFDSQTGKPGFTVSDRPFPQQISALNKLVESGDYKILQTVNPRDEALRGLFGTKGEALQYIVVKNVKTKPISSRQIPYNEGGHWMYPHTGFYVKQAQTHRTGFNRRLYDGDTTVHYFPTSIQGHQFVEAYNTARMMLKDVLENGASRSALDNYIAANLPYRGFDDFSKLFRTAEDKEAALDLNTPLVLTGSGQKASDASRLDEIFSEQIVDLAESPHNLSSRVGSQFAQERNQRLTTISDTGTEGNPLYNLRPAPLLDPMESLARSATMLAKSRFFDDYKHREIENWVNQFSDILDMPKGQAMANPVAALKNPVFRQGVNHDILAAAKSSRRSILQLLGTRTSTDNVINWTKQKAADAIFRARGESGVRLVESRLWNANTDPITAARSLVFDAKLGLFNPVQLPLQGMAATMAMAIDGNPVRSAQSVFLYWGMRSRGLAEGSAKTQGLISKKLSAALGLDESLIDEAYETWRRSGMNVIEGEYAVLDDHLNPKQFMDRSGISRSLDAGRVFFKEGNNIHRGTAFSLAFLKWRQANPKARLTNKVLAGITDRADLMYLRMSRASNAAWQSPDDWRARIATMPAQFFGFQARLSNLLLNFGPNQQLTAGEKFRLLGVNSLLWGLPIGGAGSLVGAFWPAGDSIREAAIDNGYSESTASTVQRILMNGVIDMGVTNLLGQDFNVSERFGPGGLDWMKSLMDGEFIDVLGAAPNFMIDMIGNTQPMAEGIISLFRGETDYYQLGMTDFTDAIKEISSVSAATRAWMVYNAGEWLSKQDGLIADLPDQDPVLTLAAAAGLTPQEISDTYLRMESVQGHNDAQREVTREALLNFERGLRARIAGNRQQSLAFFTRARTYLESANLTELEIQEVWREAMRDNESLLEQINMQWQLQEPGRERPDEIQ